MKKTISNLEKYVFKKPHMIFGGVGDTNGDGDTDKEKNTKPPRQGPPNPNPN